MSPPQCPRNWDQVRTKGTLPSVEHLPDMGRDTVREEDPHMEREGVPDIVVPPLDMAQAGDSLRMEEEAVGMEQGEGQVDTLRWMDQLEDQPV
jgi:hypothetical protein